MATLRARVTSSGRSFTSAPVTVNEEAGTSVTIIGQGVITSVAAKGAQTTATVVGTGVLPSSATHSVQTSAPTLSAMVASVAQSASVTISGQIGLQTAQPLVNAISASYLQGATISIPITNGRFVSGTVAGTGVVTVAVTAIRPRTALMQGTGYISFGARKGSRHTAAIAAQGALTATTAQYQRTTTPTVNAISASYIRGAAISLSGLTAPARTATATVAGTGQILSTVVTTRQTASPVLFPIPASVSQSLSVTVAGVVGHLVTASLAGRGAVTATVTAAKQARVGVNLAATGAITATDRTVYGGFTTPVPTTVRPFMLAGTGKPGVLAQVLDSQNRVLGATYVDEFGNWSALVAAHTLYGEETDDMPVAHSFTSSLFSAAYGTVATRADDPNQGRTAPATRCRVKIVNLDPAHRLYYGFSQAEAEASTADIVEADNGKVLEDIDPAIPVWVRPGPDADGVAAHANIQVRFVQYASV